jgi:hypothetical protein
MKEFVLALWAWLVNPVGSGDGKHGCSREKLGGYVGRHRATRPRSTMDSPEAGAWFAQHRIDFAAAYGRARERAA